MGAKPTMKRNKAAFISHSNANKSAERTMGLANRDKFDFT